MEEIKDINHNESPNQRYDEVSSVLNPNDIEFAGDAKNNIKFPDIECNPDAEDFWYKYGIMLEWLNDNTNEDGSWKYEGITIPEEWQEYVDEEIEYKKINYREEQEERKRAIEWIKTSKSIDISLEEEYWDYSRRGYDSPAKERYLELSDERKEAIRRDKDEVLEVIDPLLKKNK